MPYIGNTPAEKYAAFNVQHFTTSATTSYTLTHAVANELDIRLVLNNVVQQPGASYAYTASATTLTLSVATTGTDTMYAVYIGKAVQTVTPGADSVGPTALQDNAVTEAKLNVSNSPTNGYVLSAQSGATGGLTWAADAAGTITAFTNGVDNRVVTATSATALNGETNLIYDGTRLGVGAAGSSADLGVGIHIKTSDNGGGSVNAASDELVIESNGNAGMTIGSGNSSTGTIAFGDVDNNNIGQIKYNHSDNSMLFEVNASERMSIDSVGNIDTTIAGNGTAGISFKTTTDSTGSDKAYIGVHTTSNYGGNLIIARGGSDGYSAETAQFKNDGQVQINGGTGRASTLQVCDNLGGGYEALSTRANVTGNATQIAFRNPNGTVGYINTNGTTTSYGTSSDYRLKENVSYEFDATTRLKQLKPARFNFIADATTTVDGFLAHEVSSIVPEAISGEKDALEKYRNADEIPDGKSVGDNKLDENGDTMIDAQSIDQSKLVPLLVKTIQELEARITTLENA